MSGEKQKWGRQYRIEIDLGDGSDPIVISLPFTIRFWVQQNTYSELNRMSLEIFNLSEDTRSRLYLDMFSGNLARNIKFYAGYSQLNLVFSGRMMECNSTREGTDIVTRIETTAGAYDMRASQVFQTLSAGSVGDVLKFLMGSFDELAFGGLDAYPDKLSRPVVLNGSAWDLLKEYSNNTVFVYNGRIYCMAPNSYLDGDIFEIDSSTGLIGTPVRSEGTLLVTTMLETGIRMAQRVKLTSTVNKAYNKGVEQGYYIVNGISHMGTISAAVSGDCRSTFSLVAPAGIFNKGNAVKEA